MKNSILLLFTLLSLNSLHSQTFMDGLLLYYPLNGNATDLSGNAFNGVSTATPSVDRLGNLDGALEFDGINQYVITPNDLMLKPELPVSISFWVYARSLPDSPYGFGLFSNDDTTGEFYTGVFVFLIPTGQINVSYGDGGLTTSTNRRTLYTEDPITLNEWHHVVCVVSGATDMAIYIDCVDASGIYEGSGSAMVYSNSNGSLGRRKVTADPYVYFDGLMDEVAFWGRELDLSEINSLCQGVQIVTGIESEKTDKINLNISPNPASNIVTLTGDIKDTELFIIDIYGKTHKKIYFNDNIEFSVDDLPNGIYFISGAENNTEYIGKLLIQK